VHGPLIGVFQIEEQLPPWRSVATRQVIQTKEAVDPTVSSYADIDSPSKISLLRELR
jgi:hypothetical protein